MATLDLSESADITLDANGDGTAKVGPYGAGEVWTPSSVYVECSSNTSEATCKVYVGPSATSRWARDITVNGSTGDATDRCNVPIRKGSFVWGVWSGGDAGATATLNVSGSKTGA